MKVKVLYTPLGYRGTFEALFKPVIRENPRSIYSDIIYIAPTRQMITSAIKVFHKLRGGSYIQPQVLTLRELSRRLCSTFSDKVILPPSLIPPLISGLSETGIGISAIIHRFIIEIKHYYPTEPLENIAKLISSIFTELSVSQVVEERILNALKTFKGYKAMISAYGAIDEEDAILLTSEIIPMFRDKVPLDTLIIHGFYNVTNAEKSLLQSLIEKSHTTLISIPVSDAHTELTKSYIDFIKGFNPDEIYLPQKSQVNFPYHPFPSMEEEVEAIARHIKSSFISGRLKDLEKVVVAFPEIEQYKDMVMRVFKRYGIPHTITEPLPLGRMRHFLDILSLLSSVGEDYPRLSFSNFLSSPYFHAIPQALREAVPKISANSGIIKGKEQWLMSFKEESVEVYRAGRNIFRRLKLLESIKDRGDYRDYLRLLNNILKGFGFKAPQETLSETKELLRGISLVSSIAPKKTNLMEFVDGLRYMLEHTMPLVEGSGVSVMSLEAVAGLEPEFLYLGGLKDGALPSMPPIDHLLPDNVRRRLGFPNLSEYLQRQEFLFRQITSSPSGLYLTYPTMDGDKFFLPSLFLRGRTEIRDRVSGVLSMEEELLKKRNILLSAYIREIKGLKRVSRRFSENSYIHVTDIDRYRLCPRRFFIERILALRPDEMKEYRLEPILVGSVLHEVMEGLIPNFPQNLKSLKERAGVLLNTALHKKPINSYWKALIRDSFLAILPQIYELEESIRAEGYTFKSAEFKVKGEPFKGVRLKGKIDRVDVKNGSIFEIIDYKTGRTNLTPSQVIEKGAFLQPFLYASILQRSGLKTERVGMYSLKETSIKWIPGKTCKKTLNDFISTSMRFLEETVKMLRRGDFTALPLNEQLCKRCHERPYCPYIQGVSE